MNRQEALVSVIAAIYERRSVRSYLPRKLEWAAVYPLLTAAVQAPTAMHQEPWEFVVVQDVARLKRVSDRARLLFADEPHPELLDRGGHALDIFTSPDFDIFYGAGTLIIIGTRSKAPLASADCWLAAQNLMLAACASGLATCVIGSALAALNHPETKVELDIPAEFTAVAPITLGVSAGETSRKSRRDPVLLSWI